ncbi:interleukin-9 [Dasypus novemcinctus]|uniref:interleukin-9 n=1 Tax=Dasypus novemcinctus TaxID=9361 RepID=UPI0003291746|nr:interleukin-9 [Dasypus novemcinctus]
MLPARVLVSTLLLCSVGAQSCSTTQGIRDVSYLVDKLQGHQPSKCNCSTNVTDCLCLPIPSDNCTAPCFQQGLSQITNTTVEKTLTLIFYRVKRTIESLQRNKCQVFSCEQPCSQATAGNLLTFLKSLREIFQKEGMRGRI